MVCEAFRPQVCRRCEATGAVSLEQVVDRRSVTPTRRRPRPAPDFRQTEDWQRAKEAQKRPERSYEQRPGLGLRPLGRQERMMKLML